MKIATSIFGIVTAAFLASAAIAADTSDRTSMPNACSERDANCVIQDGVPRRRGGAASDTPSPGTTGSSTTSSGPAKGTPGVSVIGSDKAKGSGSVDPRAGSR